MKIFIAVIMLIGGVVLGGYVGVWLMFIGGIVQIIEQVRAEHLEAMQVGFGVARIFLAGLSGMLSAMFLIIPAMAILSTD